MEMVIYLLGANDAAKENGDDDGDTDKNDGGPFFDLDNFSSRS